MINQSNYDLIFYTHASEKSGFGHAARCVKIAKCIAEIKPQSRIGFSGDFSTDALQLMNKLFPIDLVSDATAHTAVYDRMDDFEDPSVYNGALLSGIRAKSRRVFFLANGLMPPSLPEGVKCIGYKLGGASSDGSNLFWGLEYAPTDLQQLNCSVSSDKQLSAFVALGGETGSGKLTKVIETVQKLKKIKHIDVLHSPVNSSQPIFKTLGEHTSISFHRNLTDLSSLVTNADIVIASYGHFAYEAIAAGAAVCLFGQKNFQSEYAQRLDNAGLCVAGGELASMSHSDIERVISKTIKNINILRNSSKVPLDGFGIQRMAELISNDPDCDGCID